MWNSFQDYGFIPPSMLATSRSKRKRVQEGAYNLVTSYDKEVQYIMLDQIIWQCEV